MGKVNIKKAAELEQERQEQEAERHRREDEDRLKALDLASVSVLRSIMIAKIREEKISQEDIDHLNEIERSARHLLNRGDES